MDARRSRRLVEKIWNFAFSCIGCILRYLCYTDELTREEDVLEWLVQNKSTGDEDDVIEDVTIRSLETLIDSVDNLVVLFCKSIRK
jgi:hypothetical protein